MAKRVVANWKMNGSTEFANNFLDQLIPRLSSFRHELVICPPALYLACVASRVQGTAIAVGGQDCSSAASGAFTGEISAEMLADVGCRYVIVGHSERRGGHHETSGQIRQKAERAIACGLTPIVCIGEPLEARLSGATIPVLLEQLSHSLPMMPTAVSGMPRCLVAYEPIWAIGTGKAATLEDVTEVHGALRGALNRLAAASPEAADLAIVPLFYGGSVTAENAAAILALPLVDGVLVGGASLKADALLTILSADNPTEK